MERAVSARPPQRLSRGSRGMQGALATFAFNLCNVYCEHKPLILKVTHVYDFVLVLRQVKQKMEEEALPETNGKNKTKHYSKS